MMNHLLEALDGGEDIGHYDRLTFAMVAHHFLEKDELVEWLTKAATPTRPEPARWPSR